MLDDYYSSLNKLALLIKGYAPQERRDEAGYEIERARERLRKAVESLGFVCIESELQTSGAKGE